MAYSKRNPLILFATIIALGLVPWVSDAQMGRRERRMDRHRPRVHADVLVPPEVLEPKAPYFYGRERIEIPGAVAVNAAPYVCDLDARTFSSKAEFAAHLRVDHAEKLEGSAEPFVVREGQVHFVGK